MNVRFEGTLPEDFDRAFSELQDDLQLTLHPDGRRVRVYREGHLSLAKDGDGFRIGWAEKPQLYRALSLLSQYGDALPVALCEAPAFQSLGFLLDCSRGAVPKTESIKRLLRWMAQLGFTMLLLYTEDTLEVDGYPYVGHLRGRYTQAELRGLDAYGAMLGIELCPCIQVLGHLNRVLHWPGMAHLKDTEEILLAGDEAVYAFIEALIEAASAPVRSKRIYIGLDEAGQLGQGRYRRLHGDRPPFDILREHLNRVADILRRQGLRGIMCSDTYFRLLSPTHGYYDSGDIPPEIAGTAPADIDLCYWDYYHNTPEAYGEMFKKHQAFAAPTIFMGGIWTWCGPTPDYTKAFMASRAALEAAKAHGVSEVIATAWGDNGAECPFEAALPGLVLYAEGCYAGDMSDTRVAERLEALTHMPSEAFLGLSSFNAVPGMRSGSLRPVNAAKFLLYQDPLVQLYGKDTEGLSMAAHYEALADAYRSFAKRAEGSAFADLFAFYHALASALSAKCRWHEQAGPCVRTGDRAMAEKLVHTAREAMEAAETLRRAYRGLWYARCKPFGHEILDIRLGGVVARLETAGLRMADFAAGRTEDIEELSEPALPYITQPDGTLFGSYAWGEIVSSSKTDI